MVRAVNALSRSHVSLAPRLHSHLLSLRTWGQADTRHSSFQQYRLDCPHLYMTKVGAQKKNVGVIRTDTINSENKITWIRPKTYGFITDAILCGHTSILRASRYADMQREYTTCVIRETRNPKSAILVTFAKPYDLIGRYYYLLKQSFAPLHNFCIS